MQICPGCLKPFEDDGLAKHLSQTKKASCKNVRFGVSTPPVPSTAYELMPGVYAPQATSSAGPASMLTSTPAPLPFAGDFYGTDYTAVDLGQVVNSEEAQMEVDGSVEGSSDTLNSSMSHAAEQEEAESDAEEDAVNREELMRAQPAPIATQPPPASAPASSQEVRDDAETTGRPFTAEEHAQTEGLYWDRVHKQSFVDVYPETKPGAPIPDVAADPGPYERMRQHLDALGVNIWAPFKSKLDWCMAYWAKTRGPSSTAVDELFAMEDVPSRLGLSYKTMKELNKIIDEQLPGRPKFRVENITIGKMQFEIYLRDIIPVIRALFGNPEFASKLLLAPERHYKDGNMTIRCYSEMNTGKWWWSVQAALEGTQPGATIVPIIISTDKTQLTMFRNKAAYPVYLTIGNIPKDLRCKPSHHAQVLIGYLPTAKLDEIPNKASRRRTSNNLFHECMRRILAPLKEHGVSGLAMARGDGVWFRCHPILACYVADYPEQVLVACTTTGDCVPGASTWNALDDDGPCEPRDLEAVLDVFALADNPDPKVFHDACTRKRLKPVYHPFWEDLPFCNIFVSITPDVLHQLYQGVVKHLVSWVCDAYGAEHIDARCRAMPPNHNTRIFTGGISSLSRVSGTEHRDICRILLGLIVDLPLPNGHSPAPLVRCVRAILDFLHYAQYPELSDDDLRYLDACLDLFHDNRKIFVDLGIRINFNLPKLHHLRHYRRGFEYFGTSDNYNTEQTERLHIDFTKTAWRQTNKKDAYSQMTTIVERIEALHRHASFVDWRCRSSEANAAETSAEPNSDGRMRMHVQMTKWPSANSVEFDDIDKHYGAKDFSDALAFFSAQWAEPTRRRDRLLDKADQTLIPNFPVSAFHKVKFWNHDALRREDGEDKMDCIHVRPLSFDKRGRVVPGRFDTALVKFGATGTGDDRRPFAGMRVGQVRIVFKLHAKTIRVLFPDRPPPEHLAYVEWFTPFARAPEADSGAYRISRSYGTDYEGQRLASIVPLHALQRSVQLFPCFGPSLNPQWTSYNVLEECEAFRVNPYVDNHFFRTIHRKQNVSQLV